MFLVVHNQSKKSFFSDGIRISSGHDTYVPIKRLFYRKLGFPYSDCIEDLNQLQKLTNDLSYLASYNITKYDQEYCLDKCLFGRYLY